MARSNIGRAHIGRVTVIHTLLVAAFALTFTLPAPGMGRTAGGRASGTWENLQDLAWMTGTWRSEKDGTVTEETWLPPEGGVMRGIHWDTSPEGKHFFEVLRIEARADGIYYLARPMGRQATAFKLADMLGEPAKQHAAFANPDHDFPQRIIYRLGEKGDVLHVRIEGEAEGKTLSREWAWPRTVREFEGGDGEDKGGGEDEGAGKDVGDGATDKVSLCPDLSPAAWGEEELSRFAALNRQFGLNKPLASGEAVMVVGTTGPLAIRAGYEALLKGGSAVDAALTTALGQIALCGGCWTSYAGIMTLVYYEAGTGKVYFMDACFNAPLEEDNSLTIPKRPGPSGRTALVPGFMAGLEAAHERFGYLPFAALFEPALYFAEQGVEVGPLLANLMASKKEVLSRLPATRAVFFKEDGSPYTLGERFRQPELARTLRAVAREGADHMYRGPWAEAFVEAVRAEGGKMTLKDLETYSVTWSEPYQITYWGFDIFATGAPLVGGLHLLESLNLLELSERVRNSHYTESPEALYDLIQAARMSLLITHSPKIYLKLQLPELSHEPAARLSKAQALMVWEKLKQPGWIQRFQGQPAPERPPKGSHSDGVVAVDAEGNIAALTHTINCASWGASGIVVKGISVPDAANFQQDRMKAAGPGGRIPNEMTPLIVFKDGTPRLASSTIGGGLHEATLQSLHNVLDFGMNPKKAAEISNFLGPYWLPDETGKSRYHQQVVSEGEFSKEVLDGVRRLGQPIAELPLREQYPFRGYWIGVAFYPDSGLMKGCVCPLLNGNALGR